MTISHIAIYGSVEESSASSTSIARHAPTLRQQYGPAADLAVALGNFANEFASGFMLGNFWLIYWNQLSEFDGYDSQCW